MTPPMAAGLLRAHVHLLPRQGPRRHVVSLTSLAVPAHGVHVHTRTVQRPQRTDTHWPVLLLAPALLWCALPVALPHPIYEAQHLRCSCALAMAARKMRACGLYCCWSHAEAPFPVPNWSCPSAGAAALPEQTGVPWCGACLRAGTLCLGRTYGRRAFPTNGEPCSCGGLGEPEQASTSSQRANAS